VDGDVVWGGLENSVIFEAAEGARQDLGGGAALGGDEVAGLSEIDPIPRLELNGTGSAQEVDGDSHKGHRLNMCSMVPGSIPIDSTNLIIGQNNSS
jgi:hypothetical protein